MNTLNETEIAAMRATVAKAIGLHDRNLELAEENRNLKADNAALRAALRGIVFAADDVLCDPEGRCVFQGTDADRHHVQVYLDAARAALAGGKEATP